MGLSVGGGGVGTDLGGGDDGLGGGGGEMLVGCRFSRVCGELWEDFPHGLPLFLDLRRDMFLVSLERRSGDCGRGAYYRKCGSVEEAEAWYLLTGGVGVRVKKKDVE